MPSTICPRPLIVFTAVASFLCASCATQTKKIASPPPAGAQILKETEYEYVKVTGSNIPVRVPKSPTVRPLPAASPVTEMSAEQFRDVVQRGLGSVHH